jgi:hypothetical protein
LRRGLAALAAAFGLPAGAADLDAARWYLQVDNDVAFHTDRWYTSGVRIGRVAPHGDHEIEWNLLQEIYTPEAKYFSRGTVDRAPSGRLLLGVARHDRGAACFQTRELAVGVRGPSAEGERATDAVHRLVPAPEVDWRREEGDRVDAQLTAARSQRFGEATLHVGGVAGNTRIFAHAGAQWDFGATLDSPVMRFAATPPPRAGDDAWGAFVGVSARVVGRDELLDRPYDPATAAPDLRRGVARIAAGVGLVRKWGSVMHALAADTREFAEQRTGQRFGSLTVHLDF